MYLSDPQQLTGIVNAKMKMLSSFVMFHRTQKEKCIECTELLLLCFTDKKKKKYDFMKLG